MDAHLASRLQQALAHRHKQREHEDALASSDLTAVHEAHDRVLAEVPGAFGRLGDAVAEINDAVDGKGVRLSLEPILEPGTIEASFIVSLWPEDAAGHGLVFNVNHEGQLIALLSTHQARTRLKAVDIREADRAFYLGALVSLVEAGC